MFKSIENGITYDCDPRDYHKPQKVKRGHPDYVMSKSEMWKFRKNPHKWLTGEDEDATPDMEFGTAVDILVLTPNDWGSTFAVAPETYGKDSKPWNWNANEAKEFKSVAESRGQVAVKQSFADEAKKAASRIESDKRLSSFIHSCDKQVRLDVNWNDKSGIVVPFRCLIDLVPRKDTPFSRYLGDLKCTGNAEHHKWDRMVFDKGYHYQGKVYMDAYNAASGENRDTFVHAIIESNPPYEPARRMLSEEFLKLGYESFVKDMDRYCECLSTGIWGGYDDYEEAGRLNIDGWTVSEPSKFMFQ